MTKSPQDITGRKVAEAEVPRFVIDAFERRYRGRFSIDRDDHEWRNTWRYKHEHIQSIWEGWRDGWLALAAPTPIADNHKPEPDPALPCDVSLPPATTFKAGVPLSALLLGLKVRGMAPPEPIPATIRGKMVINDIAMEAALLAFDGISESMPPAKARRRRHVEAAIVAYLKAMDSEMP